MTRLEALAYAAGIMDGEGTIEINVKNPKKGGYGQKSPWHYLRVSVANTDVGLIYWFQRNFGGAVGKPRRSSRGGRKSILTWAIVSKQASDFLKLVLPYLMVKKRQAELGVDFHDTKCGKKGLSPSEFELKIRYWYKTEISRLNKA